MLRHLSPASYTLSFFIDVISSLTIMKQRDRNVHRPQPSLPSPPQTGQSLPCLHCNTLIPQRNDFDQNHTLQLKSSLELGVLLRIIELQCLDTSPAVNWAAASISHYLQLGPFHLSYSPVSVT